MGRYETYPPIPGKVYIYALQDPVTNEIRYVGKTVNPKNRCFAHMTSFELRRNTTKNRWLKKLKQAGLKPLFVVLEIADDSVWQERECWHIDNQRTLGVRLTNTAPGGLGGVASPEQMAVVRASRTIPVTEETRRKMSEWQRGRSRMTLEQRAHLSMVNTGKQDSPETRVKRSISHLGKKHSQETKDKISAAKRGKSASEKMLTHMRLLASNRVGKKESRETRERKSQAALKRAPDSQETRDRKSRAVRLSRQQKKNLALKEAA